MIHYRIGHSFLEALEKADISIPAVCGGRGKCGKCKIKILNDQMPHTINEKMKLTSQEMEEGIHLACQIAPDNELEVEIVDTEVIGNLKKLSYGLPVECEVDHHLMKLYVELNSPSLENPVDDLNNLEFGICGNQKKLSIPIFLLQSLSNFLRKNDFKLTLVMSDTHVINIEAGDTRRRSYGLAFDLGTTSIAGMLIDMNTGDHLAICAETNPQHIYGADVISRLNYAVNEPGGLGKLQGLVIKSFNQMIDHLTKEAGVNIREIYEICVAGNSIMNHLFLGVNPQYIGESPYIPTYRTCQSFNAEEIGLTLLPKAPVTVLPNISGYVGGDITGFILAHKLHQRDEICLGIDIGTNGEIVLGSRECLYACSAAAGPAFEGGHISCGMRAATGAIEKVTFAEDSIYYEVIDDVEPIGICGTGLVDLTAELLRLGIIDRTGKICRPEEIHFAYHQKRIFETEHGFAYMLVSPQDKLNKKPLLIHQKDIRELQLAKGAFAAGIKILMKEAKIAENDINTIYIAGAFGMYINKYNAQFIGLIPRSIDPDRVIFVGNAASIGAKKFLLSMKSRAEAQQIVKKTRYIELSARLDFQNEFAEAMFF